MILSVAILELRVGVGDSTGNLDSLTSERTNRRSGGRPEEALSREDTKIQYGLHHVPLIFPRLMLRFSLYQRLSILLRL